MAKIFSILLLAVLVFSLAENKTKYGIYHTAKPNFTSCQEITNRSHLSNHFKTYTLSPKNEKGHCNKKGMALCCSTTFAIDLPSANNSQVVLNKTGASNKSSEFNLKLPSGNASIWQPPKII